MSRAIVKVAAVVLRGGLLLVVRKRGTPIFISPGGKPEPGETDEVALARELREETGMTLRAATPWGEYTAGSALETATDVRVRVYLAEADGVARPAEEIEEVAWIDGGYAADGVRLGSVFGEHVVPDLLAGALLRPRRRAEPAGDVVLVADLDGTLASGDRPPGPAVADALTEIAARGDVRLVLATARAPRGVRALVGPLADRVELLCRDGAVHVADGNVTLTGATKALALAAILPPGHGPVVAFGTDADDQILLAEADRGVVVGDGLPGLEHAGHISRVPAEDASIAAALLAAAGPA